MFHSLLRRVQIAVPVVSLTFAFVAVLGAFVLSGITPAAIAKAEVAQAAQFPRNPTIPTEVVIIGTQHSAQLEYEDHAPAHFRALLNRIDPAAVGVETPPWWYEKDIFYEIAYESYGVAVPWAKEKDREIRPVDWQPVGMAFVNTLAWPLVEPDAASDAVSRSPASDAADEVADGLDGAAEVPQGNVAPDEATGGGGEEFEVPDTTDLFFADTPTWRDAINRSYAYSDIIPNPSTEAMRRYMLYRNLMIAREIVNMAADFEGERVAVLIGAAHKPDLDLFLAAMPNIVVRQASEWRGVTEAEVAAEERRHDHLAILWFNLASRWVELGDVDVDRMDALLTRLEGEAAGAAETVAHPGTDGDLEVRFLRARWHAVHGDEATALAIYKQLAWQQSWQDRPFTHPDRALAERVHTWWNTEELLMGEPEEFGLANVFSPVGNLTVRQRILYELARQDVDPAARERAREELREAELNPTQRAQLQALLDS